jgi:lipopolysaccharide biosynthesis glycosyltransferase
MKRAYVTLLCGGDAYVPGIEALGQSLIQTGTAVPLVVMVTPEVPTAARQRLSGRGFILRDIEPIKNPRPDCELLYPRFALTYTKLRVFDLAEYDKVVWLDADTVVLRNIDELFDRPCIAAASDFFMPDRFNSGVMVLDPSPELFNKLMVSLASCPTYDGGDQGFLNSFWSDWWAMPVEHRLPAVYNIHHFIFQFMAAHPGFGKQFMADTRIIHYTLQKPWLGFTITGGSSVWWNKFFAAHTEDNNAFRRRLHELQDWSFEKLIGVLGA